MRYHSIIVIKCTDRLLVSVLTLKAYLLSSGLPFLGGR